MNPRNGEEQTGPTPLKADEAGQLWKSWCQSCKGEITGAILMGKVGPLPVILAGNVVAQIPEFMLILGPGRCPKCGAHSVHITPNSPILRP